jgi:AraC-like DNA-binding protein
MISPLPHHRFTDLNDIPLVLTVDSSVIEIQNWGFIEPSRWRNYLHVHSFVEVCYAFAGRGTFRILDRDHEVRAGDVFVAKPGEPHEILSSNDAPLGIYFWAYTLLPPRDRSPGLTDIDALFAAFVTSTRPVSEDASSLQGTLDLLTAEIMRREAGYVRVIEGLVLKLLLDTSRAVVDPPIPPNHPSSVAHGSAQIMVDHVTTYLRDNLDRPIAIRDIAAQVHLSERHTSRLFRAVLGTSIAEYLTALRVEVATQLLLDQKLSIKQVAHTVGYPDVRYFTTIFRRRIGLPPAAFRRQSGTRFIDPT